MVGGRATSGKMGKHQFFERSAGAEQSDGRIDLVVRQTERAKPWGMKSENILLFRYWYLRLYQI